MDKFDPKRVNTYCAKGIAACHAVDAVRKRFKDPYGMFEEEFLIVVGHEFEKELDRLQRFYLTKRSN